MSRVTELSANIADHAGGGGVRKIVTAGTYALTPGDRCIDCVLASASGDIVLNLPDAQLVPEMIVSVFVSASDGTNDVVVNGPGVGTDFSEAALDAAGDNIVLRSDGLRWTLLSSVIA